MTLFHWRTSGHDTNPVDEIEGNKDQRYNKDHNFFNRFGLWLLAGTEAVEDKGELEEDEEDEDDAHQHPDVQIADIAHLEV
jgi:hypothetical protein